MSPDFLATKKHDMQNNQNRQIFSRMTNQNGSSTEEHHDADSRPAFDESLFVPFPDLSSVPLGEESRPSNNKRRQTVVSVSTSTMPSAPISLPETHIQRTHSELQFDADTLNAEYKDVVMYSRLMTGMHNQIQRRCTTSGENGTVNVHPLSWKSMRGIIKTKQANDQELEQQQHDDGDDSWPMPYSPINEEAEVCSTDCATEAVQLSKHASKESISTQLQDTAKSSDLEDDYVFSLDL
jgi:hypothetical protein